MIDANRERDLLRQRVLGFAPLCEEILPGLDLGRDLRLVEGPSGLDLARVEGIDALGQSLAIALTTRLGDDAFNTRFGFDGLNALADEVDPVMMRERVRVSVIQVLRREARVRRIVDVKLSGDDRLEAPPPGSRELIVRVAFEAATGERVTLALGKVPGNA